MFVSMLPSATFAYVYVSTYKVYVYKFLLITVFCSYVLVYVSMLMFAAFVQIQEDERELEAWEVDMMEKIGRVEKRFSDLDSCVSDMMGQILLLVQGIYIKRGKRVEEAKQEAPIMII